MCGSGLFSSTMASHVSGGEITYVCLGNNQYLVTLNLFRDCSGASMGTSMSVNFRSTCGGNFNVALPLINPGGTEVSQLCAADIGRSTCNGGPLPGMQNYIYQGTVTLTPCNTWTMSWSLCCRNPSVNLTGATGFSMYLEATLNSASYPCNSSPVFTAQPIPYVCNGVPVSYNYSIVEPNGDSLRFTFICATTAGGAPITYNTPTYTCGNSIPGITLDPNTGQLNFTPTVNGNFVVVVMVTEYDALGNVIGTTFRDIQFVVMTCTNAPPTMPLSAQNVTGNAVQTGPLSFQMCGGNNLCFDLFFMDPNPGDSMSITTNLFQVFPGATLVQLGSNPAVVQVCFTAPAVGPPNTAFTFHVNDNACPIPGIGSVTISVNLLRSTVALGDAVLCDGGAAPLSVSGGTNFTWTTISGDPINVGTNFTCDTCLTPVATPLVSTVYQVTSDLTGGCTNVDTVSVSILTIPAAFAGGDATICDGDNVNIGGLGNLADNYVYSWSPGADSGIVTGGAVTYNVSPSVTTTYTLTLNDSLNLCATSTDQVTVFVNPRPVANAGPDKGICAGGTTAVGGTGNIANGYTYSWFPSGGGGIIAGGSNVVNVLPASSGNFIVTVTDPSGICPSDVDTMVVTVNSLPSLTISGGGSVCEPNPTPNVNFDATGNAPFVAAYTWTNGGPPVQLNFAMPTNNEVYVAPPQGTYSGVSITDANGCFSTMAGGTANVEVMAMPTYSVSGGGPICDGEPAQDIVFSFTGTPSWTFTYSINGTWDSTVVGNLTGSFYINNPGIGVYSITAISDAQCPGVASPNSVVSVSEHPRPSAHMTGGGEQCAGTSIPIEIIFSGTAPWTFFPIIDGGAQNPIVATTSPFRIDFPTEGNWSMYRLFDAYCEGDTSEITGSANVIIHDLPNLTVTGGGEICDGDDLPEIRLDFQGTPDWKIEYNIDGVPQVAIANITSSPFYIVPIDGTYEFTRMTDFHCTASIINGMVDVIIHPKAKAVPFAGEDNVYCQGTEMDDMEATPAFNGVIYWATDPELDNVVGQGNHMQPFSVLGVTQYYVGEVIGYCKGPSTMIEIEILPSPTVDAGRDQVIYEGETAELDVYVAGGTPPYGPPSWNPPFSLDNPLSLNPIASPLETTDYVVTVSDVNCPRSDTVKVRVVNQINVPTGITPDGDGYNDNWLIEHIEDYPDATVEVYNRWGDRIWMSERGYPRPWNGTVNGKPLPTGSHFFIISLNDDRTEPFTGVVTILR